MIFISLQNITVFEKKIFLYYIFECIQLVVDNCFILQVLYLNY